MLKLDSEPTQASSFQLQDVPKREGILNCRVTPILEKDGRVLGRLWIFE
jgi:hypothetical protein